MAWKIIDKASGNVFVSKSGNTFDDLNDEEKSLFVAAHNQAGDLDKYEIVQQTEEPRRTTYQERKDYFGGGVPGALAEIFPNLAEQQMRGNKVEFNLGRNNAGKNFDMVRAGVADVFSLPGRFVSSLANKSNLIGGSGEFNLGQRSGEEGGNIFGNITRDPITGATVGSGGALANGVRYGAEVGANLGNVGRYAGAALTGAVEGAGIEAASSVLNDRELTGKDLAIGAGLGAGFESIGTVIQQLLQKFGKDYVKAVASSLRLGNTDRVMTDEEFIAFLSDPRNRDALEKTLKAGSSGLNPTPFVGDRGKKLQPEVNNAKKEAEDVLQGEDAFKGFDEGIDQNLPVGAQNDQRKLNSLRMKQDGETETMNLATKFKEKKNSEYKPNDYRYIDKFFGKYNKIQSKVLEKPSVERPMSQDETFLLDQLKNEMEADKSIINGYTPEKVISGNKFLSDRMPFNDEFYENTLKPFLDGNKNVSHAFLTELHKIVGGTKVAKDKAAELREALSGLEETALKRAFTKSDKNIEVKKGYDYAMKKFKDTLSDYAEMRVGRPGVNAKGQDYIVGEENMKDYAYTYLRHVQDALRRNGVLKPDEVVALYGMATNVNDKTVQDAIIQLLRDLKVSESAVKKFEQVGGNYAMLNKARTRMKKNANEDNPFKGTVLAPIVPQEGFNTKNAIGWRLQGGNINLGNLSTTNNPTRTGILSRDLYNLGMTPYRSNRDK